MGVDSFLLVVREKNHVQSVWVTYERAWLFRLENPTCYSRMIHKSKKTLYHGDSLKVWIIKKFQSLSWEFETFLILYKIFQILWRNLKVAADNRGINKSHALQNLLINVPHVDWERQNVAPSAFNIIMQMINDHLSALHG